MLIELELVQLVFDFKNYWLIKFKSILVIEHNFIV